MNLSVITVTTILYRTVNERERYYSLQIFSNLFGETLLIRAYGSKKNVNATRTIQEVYAHEADAHHKVDVLIASKYKRGYRPKSTQTWNRLIGEKQC